MEIVVLLFVVTAIYAFFRSRRERKRADARIEARFEHSVRRARAGLPTIPISEIYSKEKY